MTDAPPALTKDAIKTILTVSGMSAVTKWLDAEPPINRYPSNCFAWIEWNGGPEEDNTADNFGRVEDNYFIVILVKHPDADKAETAVINLCNTAEGLLKANRTLNGTVQDSKVTNREHEKEFQGDFCIHAVRISLSSWRWVQA